MEISRKIHELDSCSSMNLSSVQVDRKYPITHAKVLRLDTGSRF